MANNGFDEGNDVSPLDNPPVPSVQQPGIFQSSPIGVGAGSENDVAETISQHAQPYADLSSRNPANTYGTGYQNGQLPYANAGQSNQNSAYGGYQNIYDQQAGALKGINQATQTYTQGVAQAIEQNQKQLQVFNDSAALNLKNIQNDLNNSQVAFLRGKIDPNRLWNQAGVGNKISAGIGLVLGGIGSGLTGQPNQALQIFDKMMDRDVDAQKANLGKDQTLFGMNLQRYGNQQAADAATRLQMYNGLQAQLQAKGLGLQSAQAQDNYQLGMAGLQERMIPLQIQLAKYQTTAQMLGQNSPSGQGGLPESQIPQALLTDPVMSKRLVKVSQPMGENKVYMAANDESAQKMQNMEPLAGSVVSLLKQLDTIGPSALSGVGQAKEQAEGIRAQLAQKIPLLNISQVGGKRGGADAEAALAQVSDPTKFSDLLGKGVRTNTYFRNVMDDVERQRSENLYGYKSGLNLPAPSKGFK